MTFTEIKTEIKDRLGYTATTTDTRIGRLINQVYRAVTSAIGLRKARYTNATKVVTIGNAEVTFTATEKIYHVWVQTSAGVPTVLTEVPIERLRESVAGDSDTPNSYAVKSITSNTVTIRLDATPETAYTLYADVLSEISDLSGSDEPAFPESFHDILIEGVLAKEYRKQQQLQLSRDSETTYQQRVSDLRMFLATSAYMDIQQGIFSTDAPTSSGVGGGGSGSASVGTSDLAISANWTVTGSMTFDADALHILDTNGTHDLIITPGSNLTADRVLTLTTGDAARTLTISGDATVNQDVSSTASPTFVAPIASTAVIIGAASTSGIRLDLNSGTLEVREGDDSAYGPAKMLTMETTGDATVGGDLSIAGGDLIATANMTLRRDTSDGSDSGQVRMSGGGAAGITRGAQVTVMGNENAAPGRIDLEIGNVANSKLSVWNAAGSEVVKITGADGCSWIKFNATQEASADANTLDDYRENTWTPTIGGTATYDAQSGVYTKIGRMVHIRGRVAINTIGTGSTTLVSGLPFTASATDFFGAVGYFDDLATSVTWLGCKVLGSSATLRFFGLTAAGAATTDPITTFQNGTDIYFSVVYYV